MNRLLLASAAIAVSALAVLPARADDAEDLCKYMQSVAEGANQQEGKMIDAITKGEKAVADCDGKVLTLAWTVTVTGDKLQPGWGDTLKGNIEKIACEDAGLKQAFAAGWKVTATWTPASGDAYTSELACP